MRYANEPPSVFVILQPNAKSDLCAPKSKIVERFKSYRTLSIKIKLYYKWRVGNRKEKVNDFVKSKQTDSVRLRYNEKMVGHLLSEIVALPTDFVGQCGSEGK